MADSIMNNKACQRHESKYITVNIGKMQKRINTAKKYIYICIWQGFDEGDYY